MQQCSDAPKHLVRMPSTNRPQQWQRSNASKHLVRMPSSRLQQWQCSNASKQQGMPSKQATAVAEAVLPSSRHVKQACHISDNAPMHPTAVGGCQPQNRPQQWQRQSVPVAATGYAKQAGHGSGRGNPSQHQQLRMPGKHAITVETAVLPGSVWGCRASKLQQWRRIQRLLRMPAIWTAIAHLPLHSSSWEC